MTLDELELRPAEESLRARRECVAQRLRSAGAGRLSDTFMFPVTGDPVERSPYYAATALVRWRNHERLFWIRVADVPFDLLPFRPRASARVGAVFTLGPGVTSDGATHPAVLQLQAEGAGTLVDEIVARLEPVVRSVAVMVQQARAEEASGWVRVCLAGLVEPPGRDGR